MDLLAILRTLRRRWVLILALTVVGAVIGGASTELSEKTAEAGKFYKATTTLVVDPTTSSTGAQISPFQNLDQLAVFTTTGEVPDLVAKKLGSDKSGRSLAQQIVTTSNQTTSTLAITAASHSSDDAAQLADTFAEELIANVNQRAVDEYNAAAAKLQDRITNLTNQNNALYAQIATNPPNVESLKAQQQSISNQLRLAYDNQSDLAAQGTPTSNFSILQKAEAVPISRAEYNSRLNLGATSRNNLSANTGSSSDEQDQIVTDNGSPAFQSTSARAVLGGFLGLLLGIGLALLFERLDRRVRTRAEAEDAFMLPVLAEVPQLDKRQERQFEVVAASAPLSRYAEAYRAVRSSILFTRAAMAESEGRVVHATPPAFGDDLLFAPAHDDPLVVMITSAAPNEGKTTTTVNLAATFAEAGSSVLVVNCDFRRPSIHRYFGVEDVPRRVHETKVAGVKVVTNVLTDPSSNPTQVVAAQRQVVAAARGRFDVILLDTAPLLTANDAVDLVGSADMVLLVARLGVTRADNGARTMELLNRLDAPVAGVVLVGATSSSNDYYYYYQPGRLAGGPPAGAAGPSGNGAAATNGAATNGATAASTNGDGDGSEHAIAADDGMFIPEPGAPTSTPEDD
jgi:Mrp family chromosome partitioning ATPase/capsular polysaccharide biosynthesis protein